MTYGIPLDTLARINPLIDGSGDSHKISSVIGFLAGVMLNDNAESMTLSPEDVFGLGVILDACKSALEINQANRPEKGACHICARRAAE